MSFREYENKPKYTNEMTKYYINLTEQWQSHFLNNDKNLKYRPFLSFGLQDEIETEQLQKVKDTFSVVTNPLRYKRLNIDYDKIRTVWC